MVTNVFDNEWICVNGNFSCNDFKFIRKMPLQLKLLLAHKKIDAHLGINA